MPFVSKAVECTSQQSTASTVIDRRVSGERISAQLDQLGPLPTVAMEIVQLTNDPEASAWQLEEKIACDPIITARVFKLANSAFYCNGNPYSSLKAAAARLGMNTLRNLVLSSCASQKLARPLAHYAYEEFGMWKHSLALALTTQKLTSEFGLSSSRCDDLFLASLMHDVGKLIVDQLLDSKVSQTGVASIAVEERIAGLNHNQMGVEVAERWGLPPFTIDVIRHHHTPGNATANADLVAAVHITDILLNAQNVGLVDGTAADSEVNLEALEALSLNTADIDGLAAEISDDLPNVIALCDSMA